MASLWVTLPMREQLFQQMSKSQMGPKWISSLALSLYIYEHQKPSALALISCTRYQSMSDVVSVYCR